MNEILTRYRRVADGFSARVDSVPNGDARWAGASPCADWTARDVVQHVVDAHHIFYGLIDHPVAPPASTDEPAVAWATTRSSMEAALNDPGVAEREYDGMFGRVTWAYSIDRFLSGDVLVHTWDLARALGVDSRLDPAEVRRAREELAEMTQQAGDAMRRPDVFGPPVEPPSDADDQDLLLAFTGRDPRAA